jgi:hypothetical protein
MDSDTHVQLIKLYHLSNLRNDADHGDGELHDIVGLLCGTFPILLVNKSHDDVAVSNSVQLEQIEPVALHVKLSEQSREHLNDLARSLVSGVLSEPTDIGKEDRDVGVDLTFVAQNTRLLDLEVTYAAYVFWQKSIYELCVLYAHLIRCHDVVEGLEFELVVRVSFGDVECYENEKFEDVVDD